MDRNFYAHKRKKPASLQTVFFVLGAVFMAYLAGTARLQAQNCNSNSPYDQIQSSFHSTVVTRVDGTFLVWGERSAPNGTTNNLSPLEVTPANGYTYTGNLLDISLGSNSSNNAQFFVLTTGGLYGWGTTNIVVNTTLKNTNAFGSVLMPVGVAPTDVRKMLATRDALLLLTHSGDIWISGRNAAIHGMGGVTPGAADNYWGRVTTSAAGNPVLTGVADVRISPAGAFAYTTTGDYYTWGPNVFLGDGSAAASYDRATLMQLPFTGTPVMIAMTTGVTGGSRQASYYSIDPSDGRVFSMGNNTNGQLGINNTTSQTGWVNIQVPGGGSPLLGVRFISGNDQDGWSTSSGAVTMITTGKNLYGLGSNQGTMIGGPTNNADYTTPITPAGFVFGVDNPFYVETGGHTSVYVKECSDRYCYVGHRISGSMGDGTNVSQFEAVFNCTYTAASVICGASTFDAGDAPVSYDNGSSANHYYLCMDSLYLGDIPPKPNNGLPVASVTAGADNNYGIAGDIQQGLEEDGVAAIPNYTGGTTYSLSAKVLNMMGSTANLYAWIDWNGNGVFEASEVATETYASMAGKQTKTLNWTGINESQVRCGRNYIRLRLTQDVLTDNPATTNIDERSFVTAYNGEIEDYNLIASLPVAAGPDIYTSILTPLPGGSVTMAGLGAGTWVPAPGNPGTAVISNANTPTATISAFSAPGPYTFIYTSGYEPLTCKDTMQVFFNVKPVAQNDLVNVNEGSSVTISVTTNDTDPENALDSASVSILGNPLHGTVSVDPVTGAVTYTPAPGYTGADSLTYVICDLTTAPLPSLCDTAVVYITVDEINHPPLAQDDYTNVPEDGSVTVNVSGNDTDPDGNLVPGSVSVIPGGGPSNGSFTIGGGGNITYTPDPNFFGNDTITYTICDDGIPAPAYCDTALLIITVTPLNDPPVANDDTATTPEDIPVLIPVISNDTDIDGNIVPNSVALVTPPANGTVTVNALTGEITYTPDNNFNGTDSFIYLVCDDGTPLPSLCDTALVTINVTPLNDAPVANNDNATTPEDMPVVINIPNNDTDVDGNLDLTSVTVTNGPSNGTVSIDPVTGEVTYTPNPNYNGPDNFTYSICDTGMPVLCDTAIVTINVTPVNDPPVIDLPNVSTPEDTPVTICSPIVDADAGDTFTASFCGGPYNGTSTTPVVFNGQVCI
ncbi:MAG: tandem-95 repeat protein, partial [Flavobacteriales bacterium]